MAPPPSSAAPKPFHNLLLFLYASLLLYLILVTTSQTAASPSSRTISTAMNLPRTSSLGKSTGPSRENELHAVNHRPFSEEFGAAAHEVPSGPNPVSNR
uniref:Uncharacterized protein n=1 Tax=Kalanchoe fedtschenkoi TaxID=63787 RepID=A0A7N0UPJ2_KALFE